ncbi:MAG: chemotaxis protein CheW [Deferribacterales bacterium]
MSTAQSGQQDNIYVSFRVGNETFGIGIDDVKQIIRLPHITRVPKMPDYVLGMSNLRGEVMPLTDLSLRLGYKKPCTHTDDTRVIVIEKDDTLTGLVVESVSEVKSTEVHNIDAFPEMLSADVDKKYISGILKVTDGSRVMLIQILATDEIIEKDANLKDTEHRTYKKQPSAEKEEAAAGIKEKRFISFNILEQEYAVEIHRINEIIWMPEVTAIPGLPDYVLGIFSLRGKVIPLISLHRKFGRKDTALQESSRVIIVDVNGIMVAFSADRVNAVLSVEESLIEEPPMTFSDSEESEITAILKLGKGERLVMALEPRFIVSKQELEALVKASGQTTENLTMADLNTESNETERQIVTFRIENEEYGILIEKVQEINRYTNVTKVPKTPKFIEGIINLRGEVIPLIDLRTRFDLTAKERDEFTRVIIVNLKNMKVGFVVDGVDEVLRIRQDDIDDVPAMLSATINAEFIAGVVNVDKTNKMILLLNIEDLFSQAEMTKLEKMQAE